MKQSKQIKVKLSWLIITCVLAFILFLTVYYSFLKSEEEITSWVYKGYELHFRADLRRAGEMEVRDERAIHDLLWSDEIENLTIGFSEAPDLGLVSVEAFEIAYKLKLAYLISNKSVEISSGKVDLSNLGASPSNPFIILLPPSMANETSVRLDGYKVFISGKSEEEFDLATVRFLMIALEINLEQLK